MNAPFIKNRTLFYSRSLTDSKSHSRDGGAWAGESNRGRNYNYTENTVTINMNDEGVSPSKETGKARPVWMTESTVDGASNDAVKSVIKTLHMLRIRATVEGDFTIVIAL